jgi:glycosyltransferase involved in cell wall biosynthesis
LTAVLIDGYALSDASQRRGIGTYLHRLVGGLANQPDLGVKVLAARDVELPEEVERVLVRHRTPRRFRALEHELVLPIQVGQAACDVFHSPAQDPPRRCPVPWIHTLHDLTPLTWTHPLLARDRRRWMRVGPRLRQADAVVAVSRFSAAEGIRRLGLDPRVVTVIPLGVDRATFYPGDGPWVQTPYLLHVAAWGPHKGFGEALGVVARLADHGLPHRLMMVGPNDAWMLSQIRAAVAASSRPDRAEIAGYVDDLAATYRGADALLMSSRCEGFGLPAIEAMACGTPVVAFANSALPEVIGDGGILVKDGDVEAMTTAVRRLLGDEQARTEVIERGLARVTRFRWEDTITAHADLLRSVARSGA